MASPPLTPDAHGLDRILFGLRNAPAWSEIDAAYTSGQPVDPAAYVPAATIPNFPSNIVRCIEAWNETFRVNFFRMRAELARIAEQTRATDPGTATLSGNSVSSLTHDSSDSGYAAVFFCDDDDWFCPDLLLRVGSLDWSQPTIKVFAMLRFGHEVLTVAREDEPCRTVVGARRKFFYRFQTNNYGIPLHPQLFPVVGELNDHIAGSAAADRLGLADEYHDMIVSATNKTPCSASVIPQLLKDKSAFIRLVESYVRSLREVQLSPGTEWCAGPIDASANLFESALG